MGLLSLHLLQQCTSVLEILPFAQVPVQNAESDEDMPYFRAIFRSVNLVTPGRN